MTLFLIVYCVIVFITFGRPAILSLKKRRAEAKEISHSAPVKKAVVRSWPTRMILEEYAKVPESMKTEDVAGILEDLDRLHGVNQVDHHFGSEVYAGKAWAHWKDYQNRQVCERTNPKHMCNPYWNVKKTVDKLVEAGKEQERLLKEQSPEYTQVKSLNERLEQNVEAIKEANKELKGR